MKNNYASDPDYKSEFERIDVSKHEEVMNGAIMNPGHVDEAKWKKAKEISQKTYGEKRWPFVMWLYKEKL